MSTPSTDLRVPLLLIHGFPHDRTLWRPQVEGLRDIARPIAPDLRGFGDAGTAPDTMTMADHAADLKALLDSMRIPRAVVCGLSMGGYIALAFLAKYPDMVQGLVLCNTRAGADSEEARKGRQATAKKALEEGTPAVAQDLFPKMIAERTRDTRPDIAEHVLTMMERQRAQGVASAARGMAARPDRTGMLPGITVPTLIVTGSEDALIPVSESEAMHKAVPGSELMVVPNVGHLSNMEDAEAFNAGLRLFLLKVGRRKASQQFA